MITWNYRVFREDDSEYIIREVFYAEDGTILGCTANAVEPYGRTPVLTLEDIPQPATVPGGKGQSRTISSGAS